MTKWHSMAIPVWVAWAMGRMGSPTPAILIAGAGFVFFGAFIPIALFRVLEDRLKEDPREWVQRLGMIGCNLGKCFTVGILFWAVGSTIRMILLGW